MPEVGEEPASFQPLARIGEEALTQTEFHQEEGFGFHEWSWVNKQRFDKWLKQNPDPQKQQMLTVIFDLLGGASRLPQEILRPDKLITEQNREMLDRAKLTSATIQHNFVDSLSFVADGPPPATHKSPEAVFGERMYNLVYRHQSINNLLAKQDNLLLPQFWNGFQNQFALVGILKGAGFKVILPDYRPSVAGQNKVNEVLEWDVKNGVDLIVEKGGKAVLVDSKGSMKLQGPEFVKESYDLRNPRYAALADKLRADRVVGQLMPKLTIKVPTSHLTPLPSLLGHRPTVYREAIRSYARLPRAEAAIIIDQTERALLRK